MKRSAIQRDMHKIGDRQTLVEDYTQKLKKEIGSLTTEINELFKLKIENEFTSLSDTNFQKMDISAQLEIVKEQMSQLYQIDKVAHRFFADRFQQIETAIVASSDSKQKDKLIEKIHEIIHDSTLPLSSFTIHQIMKTIFLAYKEIPFPPAQEPRKYIIFNQSHGGFGDIAASAKIVIKIRQIDPEANVHWNTDTSETEALSFIPVIYREHIKINPQEEWPSKEVDLFLYGPLRRYFGKDFPQYTSVLTFHEIGDPTYIEVDFLLKSFKEIPHDERFDIKMLINGETSSFSLSFRKVGEKNSMQFQELPIDLQKTTYQSLKNIMLENRNRRFDSIAMGLYEGSGVFLEPDEKTSQEKALTSIEDKILLNQITPSTSDFFETHVLAFGYAHHMTPKGHFIDFISAYEKEKDITAIFIQKDFSCFIEFIFNEKRLAFLKKQNIGKIEITSEDTKKTIPVGNGKRILRLIFRDHVSHNTMKQFQKGADFYLATGDNSATEAFSHGSHMKFFMYENLGERWEGEDQGPYSSKTDFLMQQIDLATKIYEPLGELQKLTSQTKISPEEMRRILDLFQDPEIPKALQRFRKLIKKEYDFYPIIEGMIKRKLWHKYQPNLAAEELKLLFKSPTFDQAFKARFLEGEVGTMSPEIIHHIQKGIQTLTSQLGE